MCLLLLLPLAAASPAGAEDQPGAGGDRGPDPVDFAIVVDQSKSLSETDLAREVGAAALLAQGEISERSRAVVIGFGSAEEKGQSAVHEVCPLTVADAAGRQKLSRCVQTLARPDRKRIGPGTDFPAAIRQAVDRLTEDAEAGTPKVVFLLTDGKLDVRDSPEYGGIDEESRQQRAEAVLAEELVRARQEQVQVWPLGFGSEIDGAALDAMAAGGYRNGCADLPEATPRKRIVTSSEDIDQVLQETFAAARCARVEPGTAGRPPTDLYVEIPPIATDGSITVTKHDSKVSATYYDPEGRKVPSHGSKYGSGFEVSGQDGPVEALRVKNPLPGKWRVHLDAPEGHRDREATVRAIWQGRLRSSVIMNPSSPRPGETATVEVRLQTRDGVEIADSRYLDELKVSARLEGDGFEPVEVALRDDGEAPDERASDVRFTGSVDIPQGATGSLVLTGEIAAPGVTGDQRPYRTRTTSGPTLLEAAATVDDRTVHPGGRVTGTLVVTNNDSRPHTLRLGLADLAGTTRVRISPTTVDVPPGSSEPIHFTVSFGDDVPLGRAPGSVTVTDLTDGDRKVAGAFLDVEVEAAPTWWDRWWGAAVPVATLLVLIAAAVVIRLRAARAGRDARGLELELRREGRLLDQLKVRNGQGRNFRFVVDNTGGARPGLRRSTSAGSSAYSLHRTSDGAIRIRPPRGRERSVRPDEAMSLGKDLDLVVRDTRVRRGGDARVRGLRNGAGLGGGPGRATAATGASRWRPGGGRPGSRPSSGADGGASNGADPASAQPRTGQYDPNF